jgi:hypothetical protein
LEGKEGKGKGRERGLEGVKKSDEEKNNSRKAAKAERLAKQTKGFSFALLGVFATSREIVYFFTPSRYAFSRSPIERKRCRRGLAQNEVLRIRL